MNRKVIFLTRAYNDLDCRLPLLLEFAKDGRYSVEVIGIPSNSGIHDPRQHELSFLLTENNVSVSTVYDRAEGAALLKAAYRAYVLLERALRAVSAGEFGEAVKRAAFRIVFALSVREKGWIRDLLKDFRSAIVLLDEIAFHKGRSFFIDEMMAARGAEKFSVFSFLTGQDPYLDLWHDKEEKAPAAPREGVGVPLYVPGKNDKRVMRKAWPDEDISVVGNTRFDAAWIHQLSDLASKRIPAGGPLATPAAHKIVFMLSKIEYGVDLENIVDAMNVCAELSGSLVIVKPHTRGMSWNALGDRVDERVLNGASLSSTDLIEWSDTVLFTGSSIAFQAMQLRKRVIFLKHCQRYRSIFDNSGAVLVAGNKADVYGFIGKGGPGVPSEAVDSFLTEHVYNGLRSGEVCRTVKEKIEEVEKQELSHAP